MSLRFTLLAAALFAPCAHAADVPAVHFSGFGTLAWSDQNRGDADYVRPGQPRFSHLGLDSNLGLQASGTLDDIFSGTLQVLARREYTEHYRAAVEWAFVKAKLNDAVGLRVGRMALPAYLVSDSRNVGYANIAVRPPVEVYGQVPLSSLNGADLTATRAWGELTWTAQAGYGRLKNHYDTATIEGRHTLALALALETGPLTVRLGHVRTDLTLTGSEGLAGVLAALRQFGFAPLAERLDPTDKNARFTGLGLSMDHHNVLLQTEIARRTTDSAVSDNTGAYVMLGYRHGNFVPYVSYGRLRTDSPRSDDTVPMAGPLAPLALGVDAVLRGNAQSSRTVGLRWNALPSASLKLQADFVRPDADESFLVRVQPGYAGQTVRVLTAAVDFVF
jgi:hypothetical protein